MRPPDAQPPSPHAMVIDWDDLFAYTTTRSVTVRHRYLGLTYYSLLTLVLVYIFGTPTLSKRDVEAKPAQPSASWRSGGLL